MVTSFTRIVVVLSLLRTAIGLQTAPPNSVMVSLALFLTIFVMGPTLQQSYDNGIAPLLAGTIQIEEAFTRASAPMHDFMAANVASRRPAAVLRHVRPPRRRPTAPTRSRCRS